jgi:hypothetical protein
MKPVFLEDRNDFHGNFVVADRHAAGLAAGPKPVIDRRAKTVDRKAILSSNLAS